MQYIQNETGLSVKAFEIKGVGQNDTNFWIKYTSEEGGNYTIGLFLEQIANYTPVDGDFYVDNGSIIDSFIVNQTDFNNNYTVA